jgi:surface protein
VVGPWSSRGEPVYQYRSSIRRAAPAGGVLTWARCLLARYQVHLYSPPSFGWYVWFVPPPSFFDEFSKAGARRKYPRVPLPATPGGRLRSLQMLLTPDRFATASVVMFLAVRDVSAGYVFPSRSLLQTALAEWNADSPTAEQTYGAISTWDTSQVTDFSHLFCGIPSNAKCPDATAMQSFNGDITTWDTSSVRTMYSMCFASQPFSTLPALQLVLI